MAVLQKQILNWIKFKSGGKVVFAPDDYVVRQNHVQYRPRIRPRIGKESRIGQNFDWNQE